MTKQKRRSGERVACAADGLQPPVKGRRLGKGNTGEGVGWGNIGKMDADQSIEHECLLVYVPVCKLNFSSSGKG